MSSRKLSSGTRRTVNWTVQVTLDYSFLSDCAPASVGGRQAHHTRQISRVWSRATILLPRLNSYDIRNIVFKDHK